MNFGKISNAAKVVEEINMNNASFELKHGHVVADFGISVDGTWQRRGYVSLNGFSLLQFLLLLEKSLIWRLSHDTVASAV